MAPDPPPAHDPPPVAPPAGKARLSTKARIVFGVGAVLLLVLAVLSLLAFNDAQSAAEKRFAEHSQELLNTIEMWEPHVPADSEGHVSLEHARIAHRMAQGEKGINLRAAEERIQHGYDYICEVHVMFAQQMGMPYECPKSDSTWFTDLAENPLAMAVAAALTGSLGVLSSIFALVSTAFPAIQGAWRGRKAKGDGA